jgi:hypothetical protein
VPAAMTNVNFRSKGGGDRVSPGDVVHGEFVAAVAQFDDRVRHDTTPSANRVCWTKAFRDSHSPSNRGAGRAVAIVQLDGERTAGPTARTPELRPMRAGGGGQAQPLVLYQLHVW